MKTLICGAIEEEINLIANKIGPGFIVKKLGVGLIDSAISIANILRVKTDIKRVLFTGTAGAYRNSDFKIGDIVNATEHELIGTGTVLGQSYFPKLMKREFVFGDFFDNHYKIVKSASVLEITANENLANKIVKQTNASIEHMEMFSIARVCDYYKVPFNAVVGIANYVGDHSHEEWLENHVSASKKAQISIILNLKM